MENEKASFSISHDLEIISPKKEDAYPIPGSDWKYLRDKVSKIQSPDIIYHTIGSILFGVAGSAFIAALTLPKEFERIVNYSASILWAIFSTTFICGGLSLFFSYQKRKDITCSKEDVIEEMDRLIKKYEVGIDN